MSDVAAFSVLALTVSLALGRPRVGPFRIHHSVAAIIGATLTVALHLIPIDLVFVAARLLAFPLITIASLMIITLVADKAGLFELIAMELARIAGGNARRLFCYLFFAGTITGSVFTNDAAVLIFTPLVFRLVEKIQGERWTTATKIPFYFAILYVGNLVGAFVISNPINIIVAGLFDIGFVEYARWMMLPALVSMVVSYAGLRIFFRRTLPQSYSIPAQQKLDSRRVPMIRLSAVVLTLTLIGFVIGIPTWAVALCGASVLLALYVRRGNPGGPILRGVGWDVLIFVFGFFIVAMGLRNVGATHLIGSAIQTAGGETLEGLTFSTGIIAGLFSAVMNNHPTAGMMAWVIQDFSVRADETRMLVFSALIGGDLGPKMLPIGSLAALLWFRLLRDRGVIVPYRLYIKIGVPVTLAAILLSLAMLNLERWLVGWWTVP